MLMWYNPVNYAWFSAIEIQVQILTSARGCSSTGERWFEEPDESVQFTPPSFGSVVKPGIITVSKTDVPCSNQGSPIVDTACRNGPVA